MHVSMEESADVHMYALTGYTTRTWEALAQTVWKLRSMPLLFSSAVPLSALDLMIRLPNTWLDRSKMIHPSGATAACYRHDGLGRILLLPVGYLTWNRRNIPVS